MTVYSDGARAVLRGIRVKLLVLTLMAAVTTWAAFKAHEIGCRNTATTMGLTGYRFSLGTGCMLRVHGRLIPQDNLRFVVRP